MTSKQLHTGKLWFHFGYSKRLALGFCIDRFGVNVDILCFWFGVEF